MLRKFVRALLWVLVLAILASGIAGFIFWHSKGIQLYNIRSDNMAPSINVGDLVVDVKPNFNLIKPGDIISFQSPDDSKAVVTHRIVRVDQSSGRIEAKGDNLPRDDPEIPFGSVKGRTLFAIPMAGYVADFLRQPIAMIGLVYLPALLLITAELKRLMKHFTYKPYKNRLKYRL